MSETPPPRQRPGYRFLRFAGPSTLAAAALATGVYLYASRPQDGPPEAHVGPAPWAAFAGSDETKARVYKDESEACTALPNVGGGQTESVAMSDKSAFGDALRSDSRVRFVGLTKCFDDWAVVVGVADRTVGLVKQGPNGTPVVVHLTPEIELLPY